MMPMRPASPDKWLDLLAALCVVCLYLDLFMPFQICLRNTCAPLTPQSRFSLAPNDFTPYRAEMRDNSRSCLPECRLRILSSFRAKCWRVQGAAAVVFRSVSGVQPCKWRNWTGHWLADGNSSKVTYLIQYCSLKNFFVSCGFVSKDHLASPGGYLIFFGWGCATRSWKPLPYFRPKYTILHSLF